MSDHSSALSGEWTIHSIAQHRESVLPLLDMGATEVDVSGITELDSAGLQLLLALQRGLARRGLELRLRPLSSSVREVLNLYGLDATLHPGAHEEQR